MPIAWEEVLDLDRIPEGPDKEKIVEALEKIEQTEAGQALFSLYQQRVAIDNTLDTKLITELGNKSELLRIGSERSVRTKLFLNPGENHVYFSGTDAENVIERSMGLDEVIFHEISHSLLNSAAIKSALQNHINEPDIGSHQLDLFIDDLKHYNPTEPELHARLNEMQDIYNRLEHFSDTVSKAQVIEDRATLLQLSDFLEQNWPLKDLQDGPNRDAIKYVKNTLQDLMDHAQAYEDRIDFLATHDLSALEERLENLEHLDEDLAMDFTNIYRAEQSQDYVPRQSYYTHNRRFDPQDKNIPELNAQWEENYGGEVGAFKRIIALIKGFNADADHLNDSRLAFLENLVEITTGYNVELQEADGQRNIILSGADDTPEVIGDIDNIDYDPVPPKP